MPLLSLEQSRLGSCSPGRTECSFLSDSIPRDLGIGTHPTPPTSHWAHSPVATPGLEGTPCTLLVRGGKDQKSTHLPMSQGYQRATRAKAASSLDV